MLRWKYALCSRAHAWVSHGFVGLFVLVAMADALKYEADRAQILKNEHVRTMAATVTLTEDDQTMASVINNLKQKEYHDFDEELFLPAQDFLRVKGNISASSLFAFIRGMPKGASLHTHILAATSAEFIVKQLSYMDNLYMYTWNGKLKLSFMNATAVARCIEEFGLCELVADKRKAVKEFDTWLLAQLTITQEAKTKKYRWAKLSAIFTTLFDMLTYRPAFVKYFTQALQELVDDHVMYGEFRGVFMEFYELDGTRYDVMQSLQIMSDTIANFTAEHNKTFLGARYIYAPWRQISDDDFHNCLKLLRAAHRKYPHLVTGFDLVGHEDAGGALRQRVEALHKVHKDIKFYFHAGETSWHGTEADANLLDAIMLGSSRIGHALSLANHPEMLRMVKERRIAVEVAPVSNQVLRYVGDLRAHPAVLYARYGIPLVICNDDPTAFGNTALSYDFYEAFMAFSQVGEGPEFMKAAALNSIGHSSMTIAERRKGYEMFEEQWKNWSMGMAVVRAMFTKFSSMLQRNTQ